MTAFNEVTFEDQAVLLDGNRFVGCTFRRCQIVFQGIGVYDMRANRFENCNFDFQGPAANTLAFLRSLAHDCAFEQVARLFANILTVPPAEKK